jgi:hypothetical protein
MIKIDVSYTNGKTDERMQFASVPHVGDYVHGASGSGVVTTVTHRPIRDGFAVENAMAMTEIVVAVQE